MAGDATPTPAMPPLSEAELETLVSDMQKFVGAGQRMSLRAQPDGILGHLIAEVRHTRWLLQASPWKEAVDAFVKASEAYQASIAARNTHVDRRPDQGTGEPVHEDAQLEELDEDCQIRLDDFEDAQEEVVLASLQLDRGSFEDEPEETPAPELGGEA